MSDGAKKAPSALVDPAGFELLLEGLASGVVANIAQVRAGKLKPDEAADRDDADLDLRDVVHCRFLHFD